MEIFYWILGASVFGGIFSLIGGLLLLYKENFARRLSLHFVSFAIGALLGAAFFDLIPEALKLDENTTSKNLILAVALAGFLLLFVFERFLKWHHCHDEEICEIHTFNSTVIFSDTIHNFIDGVIIASSFLVSIPVGIAASLAIFFHEIPHKIGDFGVLLHGGYSRGKVIFINLFSSFASPLGATAAFLAAPVFINKLPYLLSFAAGSFIYIAATDLLPHVHHKTKGSDFSHFFIIILGVLTIFGIGILLPE